MKRTFRPEAFGWDGVEPAGYRSGEGELEGEGYRGVTRHVVAGDRGEPCAFQVRYYEVQPGGFTRLERHGHVHSVTVIRGCGYAIVGGEVHNLRAFDHVYVPPMTLHQFVNDAGEPFGFLCVVDAQRDRPQPASIAEIAALQRNPSVAEKFRA